jgi:hypothetical protein
MKKPEITGVKGTLPLGCLPRWGREGVTLLTAGEYKQMIRKIGLQQSRNFQTTPRPPFKKSGSGEILVSLK